MKTVKALSIILLALFLIAGCKSSGEKTDMSTAPNGTINIENWTWQAIATMNVGQGELKFNDRIYKFEIGGVGAGGVGIAKMSATGEVKNLKDIADFPGKYFNVKASGTIAVGAGGIARENDKEVVIKMVSKNKGVQLSIGPKGIDITMK